MGVVGAVMAAWAITSIAVGSGSGGQSVGVPNLIPGLRHAPEPTRDALQAAFAAEGLSLRPAGADLDAARFGRLRPHIAAAFELAGSSQMLVVLFDRAEPRSATLIKTMAGDRDGAESAGRIYLEYRSAGLTSATVTRIRRALNRLA
jgi:hypothetical protein